MAILLTIFAACAPRPEVRAPGEEIPPLRPGASRVVTASWYGPKFHGQLTASGDVFDMNAFTAAHKELPFGTRLRVTYLKTGRSTEVVVNDRGPFVPGRSLDLSRAAAEAIGLIAEGTGKVRITELGREKRYIHTVSYRSVPRTPGLLTVQIGSFLDRKNAQRLKEGLALGYSGAYIERAVVRGRTFYRVRIGEFRNRFDALTRARQLAHEGYEAKVVTIQ